MQAVEKNLKEEFDGLAKTLRGFAGDLRERLPQKRKMSEAEEIGEIILLAKSEGWAEDFMDLSSFFNLKNAVFPKN